MRKRDRDQNPNCINNTQNSKWLSAKTEMVLVCKKVTQRQSGSEEIGVSINSLPKNLREPIVLHAIQRSNPAQNLAQS